MLEVTKFRKMPLTYMAGKQLKMYPQCADDQKYFDYKPFHRQILFSPFLFRGASGHLYQDYIDHGGACSVNCLPY